MIRFYLKSETFGLLELKSKPFKDTNLLCIKSLKSMLLFDVDTLSDIKGDISIELSQTSHKCWVSIHKSQKAFAAVLVKCYDNKLTPGFYLTLRRM